MPSTATAERRARERQERRDTILDAAAHVFADRGAAPSTMEDIADRAEVSKGTLYLYFKSKDDLFLALTHRPLDVLLERFASLRGQAELDGSLLLRRLIQTHSEVVRAHAANLRLGIASMCGHGFAPDPGTPSLAHYRDRVQTVRATYIAAIERGMSDGTLRDDLEPANVAGAVWAAIFGANFLHMNASHFESQLSPDAPVSIEGVVPTLSELILTGLRPTEEAS